MFLILIGVLIIIGWVYILFLREFLVAHWPAAWGTIHAVEDKLWASSRTHLLGFGYQLVGVLAIVQEVLARNGFDWTPVSTQVMNALTFVPADLRAPLLGAFMILTGTAIRWLRSHTAAAGSLEFTPDVKAS